MFLCYDIIRDVPRLRSLSLSLTISSKVNATKPAECTIRGLERTHMQRACLACRGTQSSDAAKGIK